MRLAMNDHDGAVWLDANLRYRKVCSFGTPYCARNVGLCKPRWPANARDDCSLPCTHGGPPKKPPHRCPTAPLVERHAGCCCYLGGPSRPIAQILAAVSQERGGHALWCSRGCLRAGALRLAWSLFMSLQQRRDPAHGQPALAPACRARPLCGKTLPCRRRPKVAWRRSS